MKNSQKVLGAPELESGRTRKPFPSGGRNKNTTKKEKANEKDSADDSQRIADSRDKNLNRSRDGVGGRGMFVDDKSHKSAEEGLEEQRPDYASKRPKRERKQPLLLPKNDFRKGRGKQGPNGGPRDEVALGTNR